MHAFRSFDIILLGLCEQGIDVKSFFQGEILDTYILFSYFFKYY